MPKIINDPTNKILAAAVEIRKKVGEENLSMRQVAKKAGVSVGTIYNYYANKEELFAAIEKHKGEMLRKEIASYRGKDKSLSEALQELYDMATKAIELSEDASLVTDALTKSFSYIGKKEGREKEIFAIAAEAVVNGIRAFRKKETLLFVANTLLA